MIRHGIGVVSLPTSRLAQTENCRLSVRAVGLGKGSPGAEVGLAAGVRLEAEASLRAGNPEDWPSPTADRSPGVGTSLGGEESLRA
ncbi:hypothetical protein EV192_116210 [Actinocrispum wychmicini]|uniref:Uncharacterized protein n=1 Tax=Actinocrispum wychmicini TaxID=1213861 RepID=A0A4R2ISV9_9PSEU|nr:hypothetical protein EV192_116210 [Actinocrispum wychmicini]